MTTSHDDDIVKWAREETRFFRREQELKAALSAMEVEAGTTMVDSGDTAAALDKLALARAELAATGAAVATCRQRRAESCRAKRLARVETHKAQQAALAEEYARLAEQYQRIISELKALLQGDVQVAPVSGLSRMQVITIESERLSERIFELEHMPLPASGCAELMEIQPADLDEIAAGVLSVDTLAPTAEAVFTWFRAIEAKSGPLAGLKLRVYLAWDDRLQIDLDASYIQSEAFVRPTGETGQYSGKPLMDFGVIRARDVGPRRLGSPAQPAAAEQPRGRLLTPGQYLGSESRPQRQEKSA